VRADGVQKAKKKRKKEESEGGTNKGGGNNALSEKVETSVEED